MTKNKIVKNIIIIVTIVLIVLITMGFTDYCRTTHSFEKPVFAQIKIGADDGGSGLYVGIGYSINIKGNFMPEEVFKGVTHTNFFVFGREIRNVIRD